MKECNADIKLPKVLLAAACRMERFPRGAMQCKYRRSSCTFRCQLRKRAKALLLMTRRKAC